MSGTRKPKNKIINKDPSITPSTFFMPKSATLEPSIASADVATATATAALNSSSVILHLRCSLSDIEPHNVFTPPVLQPTACVERTDAFGGAPSPFIAPSIPITTDWMQMQSASYNISNKLKALETQLHHNYCENKQGACFWCTCDFDTTPVHIPKYIMNDSYYVYGRFCSPECAVGYLMNDNLDTSVKFSRYTLLNQIYGKIFGYTKNINPAPDPRYTLDKFCGNLTIAEYRGLTKINKQLFIVDKPLVKLMPELHQDMSDILNYNKLLSSTNNTLTTTTGVAPPPPPMQKKKSLMSIFNKTPNDGTTFL